MTIKSTIGIVSPYGNKNHVLNSSGEIAGNYSSQAGGNAINFTTYSKYGIYSYEISPTVNGDGINLTTLALENKPYYITFRVSKPESVRLNITLGSTTKEAKFLERINSDPIATSLWDLYGATFSATEVNGQTNLRITLLGTAPPYPLTIYLDGIQAEPIAPGGHYTTYIDGTQDGCRWLGAPHASASTRSADSRAGGIVKDFWQGYGFFPEKVLGVGAVVEDLNIDSYAFLPGGELNSSKIQPREFTIIGFFLGNSKEDLHKKAQALELELGLDTYPGRQPVRIRYYGAAVQKEIAAHYTGGLEGDLPIFYNDDYSAEDEKWMRHYKFKMKASIQFKALDPFWYEVGESATLLDTNDSATFRVVAARSIDNPTWDVLGPPGAGGTYGIVRALVEDDIYIYIGGDFSNFDGIAAADNIVRYNKQTGVYSALGTGANSVVQTLVIGPNGILYAGGLFTLAGGVANTAYVAAWDGSTWSPLSTGMDNVVFSLAIGLDGTLYATGIFANAGGGAAARIASWDGSTWAALGTGLSAGGLALAIHPLTGFLYVGGAFALAGGVADTARIAGWDGSNFFALGTGLDDSANALAFDKKGVLYVGGDLTSAGGVSANFVALWNGTSWFALGSGVDNTVQVIAIGPDGFVYVGGTLTEAGGITIADGVARWNGYTWAHLDIDLPGSVTVAAILPSKIDIDPLVTQNYTLYLGFNTTGTGAYAGLETASNDGTISAFPKIVFSRDGGDGTIIETLRNERTGRQLLFDYALLDGESLTIDLNPKNRTIVSSFFGPRMGARLKNDDFSVWQLLPGENSISSFVSEDGSPTVTGYILYRTPYKSWN